MLSVAAMISKRAQSIDSSGIRRVFDLAANLKDPINLSIGQPVFDAPDIIKEGAKTAIDSRKNGYTVTQGIPELRKKVLAKYLADKSPEAEGVDAFITSGVSGGLLLSMLAILDPGDEFLIPDPFFCMYRDLAHLINAVPTYYDTYPDFSLSLEKIERAITPKTKAIILNNPGNPTGIAYSEAEVDKVVEIAKRKNIWLIYDEIYEAFSYDSPHVNAFGKYENTIILNGFAKSHGIPGWRVGYALGPKSVIAQMTKVQQYSFVCTPSIAQWGILAGFDYDLSDELAAYREKRDFLYNSLKDKFKMQKPSGAFYAFPEAPGGSGQAFVERCIASNLLVVPGNVFSRADTHFRISFSASMRDLERGVEVLRGLV